MTTWDLATLAQYAEIFGVFLGVVGAVIAWHTWRNDVAEGRRAHDHRLFVPGPDEVGQDPLRPEFWVYPPVRVSEGWALVVAGILSNCGPSDAFSVQLSGDAEVPTSELDHVFAETGRFIASHPRTGCSAVDASEELWRYLEGYGSLDPVLRVGETKRFVVVSARPDGDPFIEMIRSQPGTQTLPWELGDLQAHGVTARSYTGLGETRLWPAQHLCHPFS